MITPELLKEEIYEIDIDWYNKTIDITEIPDFIKEKVFLLYCQK